tara:strand:+ start:38822 stop:39037 length:216 start_codon:yes stop_codon:yes gene_type:complete
MTLIMAPQNRIVKSIVNRNLFDELNSKVMDNWDKAFSPNLMEVFGGLFSNQFKFNYLLCCSFDQTLKYHEV